MKNIILISFIFVCLSINYTFSQLKDDFEKCIIINNNDKKMEGFLRVDDLTKLTSEICFITDITNKKCTIFAPNQIKSFSTESGKYFETKSIKLNKDSIQIKVFANLVLDGKVKLYYSIAELKPIYIVTNNKTDYILQNDEYFENENEKRNHNFKGILNLATDGFLTNNYQKLDFNESSFINVIESYNKSLGEVSKKLNYKLKPVKFITLSGLGNKTNDEWEYLGQVMLRVYFPKISRNASLNVGLNYSNYNKIENSLSNYNLNEKISSVPILLQYNLLNKMLRPYIMVGVSINNRVITETYLKEYKSNNFGVSPLLGVGLEIDLFNGFMIKSEIRKDYFKHKALFGVGYNFKI